MTTEQQALDQQPQSPLASLPDTVQFLILEICRDNHRLDMINTYAALCKNTRRVAWRFWENKPVLPANPNNDPAYAEALARITTNRIHQHVLQSAIAHLANDEEKRQAVITLVNHFTGPAVQYFLRLAPTLHEILLFASITPTLRAEVIALQQQHANNQLTATQVFEFAITGRLLPLTVLQQLNYPLPVRHDGTAQQQLLAQYRMQGQRPENYDQLLFLSYSPTLLMAACHGNLPGFAHRLLTIEEHRSTINHTTQDGLAAIHVATSTGNLAHIRALVAAGADVNLVSRVTSRDYCGSPLHICADHGDTLVIMEFLLTHGADANTQHPDTGMTPLHVAAGCRSDERYVRLLLDHNADPTIANARGFTATTQEMFNPNTRQLLLDHLAHDNHDDTNTEFSGIGSIGAK